MTKSIFVGFNLTAENYQEIGSIGANHFIAAGEALDEEKWWILKRTEKRLAVSLTAFGGGVCPLNPAIKDKLKEKVNQALKWDVREIWFDHFYFGGSYFDKNRHTLCEWCQGKDRVREMTKISSWIKSLVPSPILLGYFAIPFNVSYEAKDASEFGQDHRLIGKVFDEASPMLYHRMMEKPVSYISEYVNYFYNLTGKPVLPIIQSDEEVEQAFNEAKKPPSTGVCLFGWEQAIETGRVELIKRLFNSS